MMTSSNGKIFRVTGHSCGEFTAQSPVTRSSDVSFDLRLNKRLSKQSQGWWFETLSGPLWRHGNVTDRSNWTDKPFCVSYDTQLKLPAKDSVAYAAKPIDIKDSVVPIDEITFTLFDYDLWEQKVFCSKCLSYKSTYFRTVTGIENPCIP